MSRTLDALRGTSGASSAPGVLPRRSNGEDSVLASLGYPSRTTAEPPVSPVFRRILAIALTLAVGSILWQVAVMTGLVPAGLFSSLPGGGTPSPVAVRDSSSAVRQASQGVVPTPSPPTSTPAPTTPSPTVTATPAKTDPVVSEPAAAPAEAQWTQASAPKPPAASRQEAPRPGRVATSAPATTPVSQVVVPPQAVRPLSSAPAGSDVMPGGASSTPPIYRTETGDIDRFKLALYYQRSGDFENALVQYRAVLEVNELNAEAHNNLGLLYLDKTLYDEAIREFSRATFIAPKYSKAHNNLGVALLRSGKTDAAVAEFRWIVAQDSRSLEGLSNLALSLKTSGRVDEAREMMQRAISLNARYAPAHYNLALICDESGDLVRAIQHYESFLAVTGVGNAALSGEVRARMQVLRDRLIR